MYKQPQIINQEQHKTKALKEINALPQTKGMISSPIGFNEFYEACRDYPIFFAKDSEGKWFATALLGYKDNNLFVDAEGKWKPGCYIPAFIRRYPFILVKTDDENLTLAVETDAIEDVSEANKQRAFFNEDNSASELSKGAMNFLLELNSVAQGTSEFIKELENWELLEERTANIVDKEGATHVINGFFTVNEEKMAHLSDKKRADICKKGAIQLITAHLISLGNIKRMGL
jgi:hypothetical protein